MESRIEPGGQRPVRIVVHEKRHDGRPEHPGQVGCSLRDPGRLPEKQQMFSGVGGILVVKDPYQMLFLQVPANGQHAVFSVVVGHMLSHHPPVVIDEPVHGPIVLFPGNGKDGIAQKGHGGPQHLPVSVMGRAHDHALVFGVGLF